MGDAELRERPADLRRPGLVDLAAGLRRIEIVRAAIGVERAEQALPGDRLGQADKARGGAFLCHQDRRVDRPRRVVECDDEIEIMLERADPAMRRAVLEQQHAGQWPALALLAMPAAAPFLRRDQPGRVQRQPGHRVAELVAVPLHQLLVEMLHREVAVAFLVEGLHPRQLGRRRPPRRRLAEPSVAQPLGPFLRIAHRQSAEMTARHAEQLARLVRCQPPLAVALHRLFEPEHEDLP